MDNSIWIHFQDLNNMDNTRMDKNLKILDNMDNF